MAQTMAEIAETRVTIRIWGDRLDPDELTELLACPPTHSHRIGDLMGPSGNLRRSSMWSIDSGKTSPGSVDEKLNKLLDSVNDDPEVWAALRLKFDADVYAGLFMDGDNEGLTIELETLQRLGRLGLAMHFDIYALGPEEV